MSAWAGVAWGPTRASWPQHRKNSRNTGMMISQASQVRRRSRRVPSLRRSSSVPTFPDPLLYSQNRPNPATPVSARPSPGAFVSPLP